MAAQSVPPNASSTAARTGPDRRRGKGSVTGSTLSSPGQMAKGARITGQQRTELAREYGARYLAGESIRSIATSAHRSYGFIQSLLKEHGITLRGRGGATRGADAVARREAAAVRAEQVTAELHQRRRPTSGVEEMRSQQSGQGGKGSDDGVSQPSKPAKNTPAKSAKKGKADKSRPDDGTLSKGVAGAALDTPVEVAQLDLARPEAGTKKPRSDKKKTDKGRKDEQPKDAKSKDEQPKDGKAKGKKAKGKKSKVENAEIEQPKAEKKSGKVDGKKKSKKKDKKSDKKSDKKKSGKDKK